MVLNQCLVFKGEQLEKMKKMELLEILVWRNVLKIHYHQQHVIFDMKYMLCIQYLLYYLLIYCII